MKTCWIGIVGTGALVISAFGQNSVALQAPAIESVLVTISPDKSSIAAILEAEVALQPGPGCLLRVSEPVTRRLSDIYSPISSPATFLSLCESLLARESEEVRRREMRVWF
jgi:hypothetical protein